MLLLQASVKSYGPSNVTRAEGRVKAVRLIIHHVSKAKHRGRRGKEYSHEWESHHLSPRNSSQICVLVPNSHTRVQTDVELSHRLRCLSMPIGEENAEKGRAPPTNAKGLNCLSLVALAVTSAHSEA